MNQVMQYKVNLGAIDMHETEFYTNIKSHPERKTMDVFDYLIGGVISSKILVKDFGILCKEINEDCVKSDNTNKIILQLETIVSTASVLYAQICHKFNLTTEPEKGSIFELFIQKVFIEKRRQDKMWGPDQNNGYFWVTVLGEELGEFYEELIDFDKEIPKLKKVDTAIKELIQIAAVCLSWWKELKDA